MSFKYRIKLYKDEQGEYSDYVPCTKETILEIIEANWTELRPNGLHVISILNESGQSLLLEHYLKDAFDVYYLPLETNHHYHKKSWQEIIYQCLDLFMNNNIQGLESSLNKTKKDNKFIREEFFFIDHNYKLTRKRENEALRELLIFGIPIGVFMIGAGFMLLFKDYSFAIFSILIIAFGLYLFLPGLLLHFQYKKDGTNLTVRITKGSKQIVIHSSGTMKVLEKADIDSVFVVQNENYRAPWSEYGYTEITFKTGEIINLTNLMVDQLTMPEKFANDDIKIMLLKEKIPRLRNKSRV